MMLFWLVGCFQYRLDSLDLLENVVEITSDTFVMGCTNEQGSDCYSDESPTHEVTLTRDLLMMESEVTQGFYETIMGNNPSDFSGRMRPVERVSWYDAVEFANALSALEDLEPCYVIDGEDVEWTNPDCIGWRLPTEAEWEYAARVGESYKYAGSSSVESVAWYNENSARKTHGVCGKERNGYGLCDMSGNVLEWVWDWKGSYNDSPSVDPQGPTSGSIRVVRGGGWDSLAQRVRVSYRSGHLPAVTYNIVGFRLVRSSPN